MPVSMEVRGEIEARDKLLQVATDLHGRPFMSAMTTAVLIVERSAKINAPVSEGTLRNSIAHDIRTSPAVGGGMNVIGVVGTKKVHGPHAEFGTKPHWVSVRHLETWAKRHGMNAYVLQRIIARRGTKAHPYLRPALEDNRARIVSVLGRGVSVIVNK